MQKACEYKIYAARGLYFERKKIEERQERKEGTKAKRDRVKTSCERQTTARQAN